MYETKHIKFMEDEVPKRRSGDKVITEEVSECVHLRSVEVKLIKQGKAEDTRFALIIVCC